MKNFFYLLLASALFFSCSASARGYSRQATEVAAAFQETDTIWQPPRPRTPYPLPEIPSHLRDPLERARYALAHYFDNWDKGELEQPSDAAALEQSIVDYLTIYRSVPRGSVSDEDLLRPAKSAQGKTLSEVLRLYTKYLYEADSPIKDHQDYLKVLTWAATAPQVSFADQTVCRDMLALVSKNREGTPAADFAMTVARYAPERYEYAERTLRSLLGKPIILIFYTPGCERCDKLIESVKEDVLLRKAVQANSLQLLYVTLVYDRDEWEQELDRLPDFGTPAFNADMELINKSLYDLSVTPVCYIISPDGTVLKKEASLRDMRQYLSTLSL